MNDEMQAKWLVIKIMYIAIGDDLFKRDWEEPPIARFKRNLSDLQGMVDSLIKDIGPSGVQQKDYQVIKALLQGKKPQNPSPEMVEALVRVSEQAKPKQYKIIIRNMEQAPGSTSWWIGEAFVEHLATGVSGWVQMDIKEALGSYRAHLIGEVPDWLKDNEEFLDELGPVAVEAAKKLQEAA